MSMNPPEFVMAKVCFTVAATIFFARVGFWLASAATGQIERVLMTGAICAIGGVCWVELLHWVDQKAPIKESKVIQTQRPWVTIKNVEFSLRKGRPMAARIIFHNRSVVPAFEVKTMGRVGIQTDDLVLSKMPPLVAYPERSSSVLMPGQELYDENNTNQAPTTEQLNDLRTGKAHFYAYGVVEYHSASDPELRGETGYCFRSYKDDLNGAPEIYREGNYVK